MCYVFRKVPKSLLTLKAFLSNLLSLSPSQSRTQVVELLDYFIYNTACSIKMQTGHLLPYIPLGFRLHIIKLYNIKGFNFFFV